MLKSPKELKITAIRENKKFLYQALTAVENGGGVNTLLNAINTMENTLKELQQKHIELLRNQYRMEDQLYEGKISGNHSNE